MDGDAIAQLAGLVEAGLYEKAEELCASRARQSGDARFWNTQRAYVCFLNEADNEARYDRAPELLEELVRSGDGRDANALFWLGYLEAILFGRTASAVEKLRSVLELDPEHPYANIVLSAYVPADQAHEMLERALASQPGNLRVLRQLAEHYEARGASDRAIDAWERLPRATPYVESGLGVMNRYANDVLTGATHAAEWRQDAERRKASFGRPD